MDFMVINDKDNVAVALNDLSKGAIVNCAGRNVTLTDDIPRGHKFSLHALKEGENVIKYGNPIGHVTMDVHEGAHVHIQNIKTNLGDLLEYEYHPERSPEIKKRERTNATFQGFLRKDGNAGVRNELWIIPTVGCVNSIATKLAEMNKSKLCGNAEDIIAFPHPYGCSQMGDDQENSRKVLADFVHHPNAGAVLVVGLGCENSNIDILKGYIGDYDSERVRFLQCQDVEDELEEGSKIIDELISILKTDERTAISADKLIIGMKCGGSDGLSGITANPTVGLFSDRLIAEGGTTILTEVPEMFGAETLLMDRCVSREMFDKTVLLINNFKEYYKKNNQTIYENPSPGNKKGGISTLEDKSLGCTQKSGSSKVTGVLEYAERVQNKGLNLLSAPGNDLVAATSLAASGAQIVLFTTGRGTPFASPVPTIKISTNNALAEKKNNWIDFNCGVLVEGKDKEKLADELFSFVLQVASGKKVRHEEQGFRDMAIFKNGVTL